MNVICSRLYRPGEARCSGCGTCTELISNDVAELILLAQTMDVGCVEWKFRGAEDSR